MTGSNVYEILKNQFSKKSVETTDERKDIFLTRNDRLDLIAIMNKNKIALIKWMFGFWIIIIIMLLINFSL